ncbi:MULTISPECIES: hypothetical protein [Vibrio]|uniref:Uncharacterized protein n=1 Tax=Vibrio tasmaniensis TaxID=212663 RepID=A0A0H3ZQ73_9VIBR|nr:MULTISPECIES: hypothetical protein [Vibrio]AKN36562.1 hypothetical protein [Vibrio tasmaniensis]PNG62844.1 hypothetical protein SC81_19485 [Vibrio vulnificus]POC08842.1 hypothetical protein CRN54_16115 [Vibrio vulnificus]POC79634.1 hypothetical protein CRN61_09085 [Vibrio vulnificus]CAK1886698.1 Gram-positive cocci surface proteins LPxTG domain-containing protein [Vibrio crassostreae]
MAFWDDLTEFGSGLLDDVGEGMGNLIDTATKDDSSKNAGTTQQPQQPVKDNHGNAVTGSPLPQTTDKTLLYVGGGLGVALLLTVLVIAVKK